jgi:hypothetical protein
VTGSSTHLTPATSLRARQRPSYLADGRFLLHTLACGGLPVACLPPTANPVARSSAAATPVVRACATDNLAARLAAAATPAREAEASEPCSRGEAPQSSTPLHCIPWWSEEKRGNFVVQSNSREDKAHRLLRGTCAFFPPHRRAVGAALLVSFSLY